MGWWTTRPGGTDVNVPDGYDETQGKMSDVAWVAGDGTIVSILKKIAAGGGGSAVTIADGADVAEGATADASVAAGAAGTVSAKLRRMSADIGSILATGHPITGTVTADTELPAAAPLSDTTANPTAPMVGAGAMLWDGAQWVRVPGSLAAGLKVQSGQLPAALAAGGGLKIEGVAGGVAQPVSGTFWQAAQPVTDNAGSLTVDAPVATPVFVRLSDGAAAIATLPVSLATNTPDVTDRSARLIGSPTFPTLTKGTQQATGLSVQNLKDSGRVNIALTIEFAFAQTAETLLTVTESRDGAATATFTSKTITSGKRIRFTGGFAIIETLGTGTTVPQRMYLRLRVNTAGATVASSPLQYVFGLGISTGSAAIPLKSSNAAPIVIPDGVEYAGNGTVTYGLTLETPDWVVTTGTGRCKITLFAFEY